MTIKMLRGKLKGEHEMTYGSIYRSQTRPDSGIVCVVVDFNGWKCAGHISFYKGKITGIYFSRNMKYKSIELS